MKNRIYIIVLIVLAIIAAYFFFTRKSSTIESEFSDFAIEDTSLVDKIFISDYDGGTATLTRQDNNSWEINDKYKARQDGVDLLLLTFKSIKVKEMIPKAAHENIVREMAARSIKVEIYLGEGNPKKTYYVGNATQNHFGTYMLLEVDGKKSSVPFITHIPGFFGYLTARFFTDEKIWRDRNIFNIKADDIKSVQIAYTERPLKSFLLTRENGEYNVKDLNSRQDIEPLNRDVISEYLSRFPSLYFEQVVNETPLDNIDSVTSTLPLHIIEVRGKDGQKTQIKTYYRPAIQSMIINPSTGDYYSYDLDRLYGWINEEDFVMIQWPTLDKILSYNSDFQKTENVDNL